jgi:hypothetical protein
MREAVRSGKVQEVFQSLGSLIEECREKEGHIQMLQILISMAQSFLNLSLASSDLNSESYLSPLKLPI